jgi:hypothetical protein
MTGAGHLEPVDELTVAGCRAACRLVDDLRADPEASGFTVARGLAELGAWHDRLTHLRTGPGPDVLDELLAGLSSGLGDTPQP